jgi:hypothetical protein
VAKATDAPVLTQRVLNRTLLARQHLLERVAMPPAAMLEHLVGMQAQEPGDPYVGLWTRIADFDPTTLSDLIAGRAAVRIGLMRTTLHLVTTRDALGLAPIMDDVLRRAYRSSAFPKQLKDSDPAPVVALARELIESEPMTPSDLGKRLGERFPGIDPIALSLLARYWLPMVQVPPRGLWRQTARATNTTLEAWSGRQPSAATIDDIVLRYLAAFGPASSGDARIWSWLTGLREVLERLRPRLRTYRDEAGRELFDVEDGLLADPDTPAPVRFLPQYDNVFLSHDDRARINGVMTWGLEFGWKGAILVDGGITGAWRVKRAGGTARMTVELGRELTASEWAELEAEAAALARFLDPDAPRELLIVATEA